MKTLLKTAFLSAISVILLSANVPVALASTPYLTATTSGGGNVQLTINSGDHYSRIDLSYRPQGTSLWTQITNVGYTDQSGYFSQTVNIGYQGTQMDMYVTVNGQQSPTVNVNGGGCQYYGCNTGYIQLSPSTVSLNVGQSQNVTIYEAVANYPTNSPPYNNNYYISSNSNSSAVSASVSGNTVYVNGNNNGSANISVCSYYNTSTCATLYVTVSGNGCNQYSCNNQLTFSQSNVSVNVGQNTYVTIYNSGSNSFYVTGATSSIVTASVSGSTLTIYGVGAGTANVTVCSSDYISRCGTIYVTVNGNSCNYYGCNNQITFSPTNPTLTVGQTTSVSISNNQNYYNSYYISSNNNSAAVSATVSGNQISLYGRYAGNATITVCSSNYSTVCGTLYATVTGVLGISAYPNGTLVSDNGTIYITYKNMKSGFANYSAFVGLGYSLSNVISGSTSSMNNNGYVVTTSNGPHPWGSWIKNGSTIYFVHEQGLIPIAAYDVFTNNGGNLSRVVNANSYDMQRPMLSIMTYNDSRLQ